MRSYNLFRRKDDAGLDDAGLCCAVPENRAVPSFVDGRSWTFAGKVEVEALRPPGFHGRAAATAVRFNGFYLFQSADRPAG